MIIMGAPPVCVTLPLLFLLVVVVAVAGGTFHSPRMSILC